MVGTPTNPKTVRPGIHKSGDSTSRRDGLTSMVSLLVVLAVKAEEEEVRINCEAEPPLVIAAEMDVEQPREQPSIGGASSSSAPAQSGQEAAALSSPSTHEVRMYGWRLLNRSASKRVRSLAGMLLFDEHGTSDLSDDHHDQHDNIDHMQQPDTDIPGVWTCTVTELAS